MSDDERYLLQSAQNGNIDAFEKLVEGYQKKVYNIALKMLGNPEDAYELAQEVFIRIYKSIDRFKGEASLSTWIYRITTNVCLDELRKRKKQKLVYLDESIDTGEGDMQRQLPDTQPSPQELAEQHEVRQAISSAINELSEEHRLVIIMRDIQGFSYEEIAKAVNCPEGTVKSRISRARGALRDILKDKKELFNKYYVK